MIRKIVDSNFLRSTALREYLSESPQNYAVITDYASMEAYKADDFTTLFRSMEILSAFPRQVIILRNTIHVCGLEPREAELPDIFIDADQTKNFGEFCLNLALAKSGSRSLLQSLAEKRDSARSHMNRIESDLEQLLLGFQAVEKTYTAEEIRVLRTEDRYLDGLPSKMVKNAMSLSSVFFSNHPEVRSVPAFEELHNRFIFRLSVCTQVSLLRWIAKGSQKAIKPEKLRNDVVDLNFAAFALFFDGLLSNDRKLLEIYEEAKVVVEKFSSME